MKMTNGIIIALLLGFLIFGCVSGGTQYAPGPGTASNTTPASGNITHPIKEFVVQSYTEIINGTYHPKFSPTELTVNKGDLVRLRINVTSGMHSFKIDEFGVFSETPTNQVTTVEFVADKTGEFVYYCAKPGHRQAGHWGTLRVN